MRERQHAKGHLWVTSSVVDEAAIDHERVIGLIAGVGNDLIRVRVAQRIDFDLLADPITTQVSNPRITVGDTFELTPPQTIRLSDCLREAATFAGRVSGQPWLPRLVVGQ
jgi:hypothetical protein